MFILQSRVFSSPCQRQCELLPSLGVRRPLTFRILIFSSEKYCHLIFGKGEYEIIGEKRSSCQLAAVVVMLCPAQPFIQKMLRMNHPPL
jgi:hypothetical protein